MAEMSQEEVDELLNDILGETPTKPIRLSQIWQVENIGKTSIPCDVVVLPLENQVAVVERKKNRAVIYGEEGKELKVFDNDEIPDLREPTALAMLEHRLLLADSKTIHFLNVTQWLEDRAWTPNKKRTVSDLTAIHGMSVCVDTGEVVLSDVSRNPSVTVWDLEQERQKHALKPPKHAPFKKPRYVSSSEEGHVYVSDCEAHCVYAFDKKGKFMHFLNTNNSVDGKLMYPLGLHVSGKGEIIVCDPTVGKVIMYNGKGEYCYPLLDHLDGVKQPVSVYFSNGKIAVTEEILEHKKDRNYVRLFEIVKKGKR